MRETDMNQSRPGASESALDPALEAALARSLAPPPLPPRFRVGLTAAIARSEETDIGALRARYEREQAQRLVELERNYIQVRRRTLGAMVGGAFAAGAAAALGMPLLVAHFGADAPFVMACGGAAGGLGISYLAWLRDRGGAARV